MEKAVTILGKSYNFVSTKGALLEIQTAKGGGLGFHHVLFLKLENGLEKSFNVYGWYQPAIRETNEIEILVAHLENGNNHVIAIKNYSSGGNILFHQNQINELVGKSDSFINRTSNPFFFYFWIIVITLICLFYAIEEGSYFYFILCVLGIFFIYRRRQNRATNNVNKDEAFKSEIRNFFS